jgi:hypothetical protein
MLECTLQILKRRGQQCKGHNSANKAAEGITQCPLSLGECTSTEKSGHTFSLNLH